MLPDSRTTLSRRELIRALSLCAPAGVLAGLPACGWLDQPLTVAAHLWVGYEPMFLADNRQWLEHDRVKLLQTTNSMETVAALQDGRAQAGALTLDEVLRARAPAGCPCPSCWFSTFRWGPTCCWRGRA